MHDKLCETALGITAPWKVSAVHFDEAVQVLNGAHRLCCQEPFQR